MALQKLNELREVVDGDVEEMVDTMATLMILKQDMSNPMYGAKVTVHTMPDGEWVDSSADELPIDLDEYIGDDGSIDRSGINDALDNAFRWRITRRSDDGDIYWEVRKYMQYADKEKVHRDEVPDPLSPNNTLEEDNKLAKDMDGEWTIYDADFREYRVRRLEECQLIHRTGIVFDPSVADAPVDEYWDPNREEYTTPDDYPMGTVNAIVPEREDERFGEDYVSSIEEVTSLTPADGEPQPYTYTPGWD